MAAVALYARKPAPFPGNDFTLIHVYHGPMAQSLADGHQEAFRSLGLEAKTTRREHDGTPVVDLFPAVVKMGPR